jgi:hypothetical protein
LIKRNSSGFKKQQGRDLALVAGLALTAIMPSSSTAFPKGWGALIV